MQNDDWIDSRDAFAMFLILKGNNYEGAEWVALEHLKGGHLNARAFRFKSGESQSTQMEDNKNAALNDSFWHNFHCLFKNSRNDGNSIADWDTGLFTYWYDEAVDDVPF